MQNDEKSTQVGKCTQVGISTQNEKSKQADSGSVAIETAITLPFFLCVVVTLIYTIKIIYVHEIIQHALNQTANEISFLSYIYHASEFDKLLEEAGEKLLITLDEELNKLPHIPGELKEELHAFIEGMYVEDLERLCSNLAKMVIKKYLVNGKIHDVSQGADQDIVQDIEQDINKEVNKEAEQDIDKDVDKVLKRLDIIGGMDGLDMSMSGFFENENKDIDLMVKYKIGIPIPIKIFYPLCLVNRAVARAWLYGDENTGNEEDIWSLDNFTRGRKIRAAFGANLPFNFPVIAKFDQGAAIMIKSMDLTAKSYQDAPSVGERIQAYINELAMYNGQEKPWGKDGIVIRAGDIKMKKIILVIPGNPIRGEIEEILQECKIYATEKEVVLEIERYGYKVITMDLSMQSLSHLKMSIRL